MNTFRKTGFVTHRFMKIVSLATKAIVVLSLLINAEVTVPRLPGSETLTMGKPSKNRQHNTNMETREL